MAGTEYGNGINSEAPSPLTEQERLELGQLIKVNPSQMSEEAANKFVYLLDRYQRYKGYVIKSTMQGFAAEAQKLPTQNSTETLAELDSLAVKVPENLAPEAYAEYQISISRSVSRISQIAVIANRRYATLLRAHKTLKRLITYYSLGSAQDIREGEATSYMIGLDTMLSEAEGVKEAATQAWFGICEQARELTDLISILNAEAKLTM